MSTASRAKIFWTTFWVSFILLQVITTICLGLVERAGIGHNLAGRFGGVVVVSFAVSAYVATLTCRQLGISAESLTREVLTEPFHVELPEPVEVRTEPKRWRVLAWGYLIPVALFVFVGHNSWPLHLRDAWLVVGGALFVAIFGLCVFKAIFPGPPIVRLTSDTIFRGLWRRRIDWDQVRSCEIITFRNMFGDVARMTFKLYDEQHGLLMKSAFVPPIQPDEERLFNALRSRFSHAELTIKPQVTTHESSRI